MELTLDLADPPVRTSEAPVAPDPSYTRGMEMLLAVVEELSLARELADVQRIVRRAARALTGCDGATFVLNDAGDFCYYADEDAIAPLWKGKRFPQETCISGWVMRNRRSTAIYDIYTDPRIPHEAYRPTFVSSLAMVPIRASDPVGAIGNYWAEPHEVSPTELRLLQALANATSVAMENVRVYSELESRVRERTAALVEANLEIEKRSVTDELTGLRNRRGFYEAAGAALARAKTATLVFVDADGLKRVNDRAGHAAGDAMLKEIAESLQASFRRGDIIGRMGGDEFCVLVTETEVDAEALKTSVQARFDRVNARGDRTYVLSASFGIVEGGEGSDLDRLIAEGDRRMYVDKHAKNAGRS